MRKEAVLILVLVVCFALSFSVSAYAAKKKADETVAPEEIVTAAPEAALEKAAVPTEAPAAPLKSEAQKFLDEANDLATKGQGTKAKQLIEKAIALEPANTVAQQQLIDTCLGSGDQASAEQELIKVISEGKMPSIREWATYKYYDLAVSKGNLQDAVKKLETAKAKFPNNDGLDLSIAEGYVKQLDWAKVANIYEALLKKYPGDYIYTTRLLDVFMLLKKYDEVIKKLEPTVKANPENIGASDTLLHAYVGAGMKDEAVALFKKRLAQEPNSPGLIGRYAMALQQFGMLDEALKEYEKAFSIDPQNQFFKQKADEIKAQLGKK